MMTPKARENLNDKSRTICYWETALELRITILSVAVLHKEEPD